MHHLTTNSLYQLLGAVFRSDKNICQSCCIECSPTACDPPGKPEWGFQQCKQVLSPLPARYPNSETSRTSVLSLISIPPMVSSRSPYPPSCLACLPILDVLAVTVSTVSPRASLDSPCSYHPSSIPFVPISYPPPRTVPFKPPPALNSSDCQKP